MANVQAPVGGWNTLDAVDDMPVEDAVLLDNFFPNLGSCEVRKGFIPFASGLGANAGTLIDFVARTYRFFIAITNAKIWNVTSGTPVDITGSVTVSNGRWCYSQFDDASGGARVGMVNGTNAPLYLSVSGGTPVVNTMTVSGSGLTASTLSGLHTYKNRSYFWADGSPDFWYSQTNALGGTLTKFPLGRVHGSGGNIVKMVTWTVDGGQGIDDLAVFIMSTGDILIYAGDDPGTNWSIIGRYKIGTPLDKRAIIELSGDVSLATKDGYLNLSANLLTARQNVKSLADKIGPEVVRVAQLYGANVGWEMVHYPRGQKLIVNVPVSDTEVYQHVMNTRTRAWCRFVGITAKTWGVYADKLYFAGADSAIYEADTGGSDNGVTITAEAIPAWSYFGTRRRIKKFSAVQPFFKTNAGSISYGVVIRTDFNEGNPPIVAGTSDVGLSQWDTADWDTADWAGDGEIFKPMHSASGAGYTGTARLKAQTITGQELSWLSTNILTINGGEI